MDVDKKVGIPNAVMFVGVPVTSRNSASKPLMLTAPTVAMPDCSIRAGVNGVSGVAPATSNTDSAKVPLKLKSQAAHDATHASTLGDGDAVMLGDGEGVLDTEGVAEDDGETEGTSVGGTVGVSVIRFGVS